MKVSAGLGWHLRPGPPAGGLLSVHTKRGEILQPYHVHTKQRLLNTVKFNPRPEFPTYLTRSSAAARTPNSNEDISGFASASRWDKGASPNRSSISLKRVSYSA